MHVIFVMLKYFQFNMTRCNNHVLIRSSKSLNTVALWHFQIQAGTVFGKPVSEVIFLQFCLLWLLAQKPHTSPLQKEKKNVWYAQVHGFR